jgi:hypothetical protein
VTTRGIEKSQDIHVISTPQTPTILNNTAPQSATATTNQTITERSTAATAATYYRFSSSYISRAKHIIPPAKNHGLRRTKTLGKSLLLHHNPIRIHRLDLRLLPPRFHLCSLQLECRGGNIADFVCPRLAHL